jgi:hypothetical protein
MIFDTLMIVMLLCELRSSQKMSESKGGQYILPWTLIFSPGRETPWCPFPSIMNGYLTILVINCSIVIAASFILKYFALALPISVWIQLNKTISDDAVGIRIDVPWTEGNAMIF